MVTIQQCPSPVTEGNNATLLCDATGNPAPHITWIRQTTGDVLSTNGRLVVSSVARSEAGDYVCHASNGVGSNSSRTCNLNVLCKFTKNSYSVCLTRETLVYVEYLQSSKAFSGGFADTGKTPKQCLRCFLFSSRQNY